MKCFCISLLFLSATTLVAQSNFKLIPKIDPRTTWHHIWLDLSNGPSLAPGELLVAGPGVSVAWISKNRHLVKIKCAAHVALGFLENFPQQNWESNIMTGAIWQRENTTLEFHYGIGLIGGLMHGKEYYIGDGYSFVFDFTSHYEKIKFFTVGVPLEFRVQWRVMGIGAEANLNYHMPYAGVKVFTRIRLKRWQ